MTVFQKRKGAGPGGKIFKTSELRVFIGQQEITGFGDDCAVLNPRPMQQTTNDKPWEETNGNKRYFFSKSE